VKPEDVVTKEDRDRIKKLEKEREECLRPVKIRITSLDRLLSAQASSQTSSQVPEREINDNSPGSSPIQLSIPQGSDGSSSENDDISNEEELCVLESLEMLKSNRSSVAILAH